MKKPESTRQKGPLWYTYYQREAGRGVRPECSWQEELAMPQQNLEETLPEPRRMEIFLALVETQDQDVGVARSRQLVATRFGVSEDQVKRIEQEGLDREWPPLWTALDHFPFSREPQASVAAALACGSRLNEDRLHAPFLSGSPS
jgi:hypothetical protein